MEGVEVTVLLEADGADAADTEGVAPAAPAAEPEPAGAGAGAGAGAEAAEPAPEAANAGPAIESLLMRAAAPAPGVGGV